jgi:pseudouridine-5'-phosphate glycosidase/pseudouridine kinase
MSTPNVTACVGETKTQRRYNSSSVSLFDGDHGAKFVYDRSSEVQAAKLLRQPVVALETTIYTHGFPYPENLDLALSLEQIVRDNGGVPATVGIIDSQICVGMSKDQITRLASSAGKPETMKVSRRDIPYIIGMVSYP